MPYVKSDEAMPSCSATTWAAAEQQDRGDLSASKTYSGQFAAHPQEPAQAAAIRAPAYAPCPTPRASNPSCPCRVAGQLIGPNDLWIAAHALSLELPPISHNMRTFERVLGLVAET